ncbi:MAG TPA: HAD family hydrolase [Candidatus Limnocylindrales bacterium]|nr:HAD family hydrolase [Candidatus Limnocylindrales bacterium]
MRAVVFDVGETLVDESRAWLAWADHLGIPPLTFLGVLGAVIERGGDHREPFELLRPGLDVRAARLRMVAAGGVDGIVAGDLYPDAVPALRALTEAGYRVAIAGNQPSAHRDLFESLGVPLDLVTSSADLDAWKPHPRFFTRLCDALALPPEAVAYVGDRLDNDVRPAAAAGLRAVFLRRGPWAWIQAGRGPVEEAAATVEHLAGIVGVIDSVG